MVGSQNFILRQLSQYNNGYLASQKIVPLSQDFILREEKKIGNTSLSFPTLLAYKTIWPKKYFKKFYGSN